MLLRCLHCKEETSIDTATKRGKLWACDQCNKARRAILAEYTKKGQKHVRNKMSKDAKDVEIRKHKGKAPGRGKGFLSRYCCCLGNAFILVVAGKRMLLLHLQDAQSARRARYTRIESRDVIKDFWLLLGWKNNRIATTCAAKTWNDDLFVKKYFILANENHQKIVYPSKIINKVISYL